MVLALRLRRRRNLAGSPIPRSSCAARRFSAAVATSLRRLSADVGEDKAMLEVSKAGGRESGVAARAADAEARAEERATARACFFAKKFL